MPLTEDDLAHMFNVEEPPPTPSGFRRGWALRRETEAEAHHGNAQRLALLKEPGTFEVFGFLFHRYCSEPHHRVRAQLHKEQGEEPRWSLTVAEYRARLLAFARVVPGHDVEHTPSATAGTGLDQVSRRAAPPDHVILHEAPKASGGEDKRGRDAMRTELAKPKRLAGPRTRDAVDELFARLFSESRWLQPPIEWAWQRALDAVADHGALRWPPFLLVGPPGCGKSRLAERLGQLAGLPVSRIEGASLTGSFAVGGSDFLWANAHPGEAVRLIHASGAANPLIVYDEIDKGQTSSSGGDPRQALLPLFQRSTAANYRCPFLQAPIDLSFVSWILTANSLDGLPPPLLDRVTVFEVGYPRGIDLKHLVLGALEGLEIDERVITRIVTEIEAGNMSLRGLERLRADFVAIERRPVLN
ncbi:AAA family ATPase [Cereibacter sphaeroides]|uniref:AAA family ATPase n=1 Tax=Cereibacter sphaeroides TaxID=1063 RepID=UPI001F41442E|nr:AAA family ATPase [Cereibacter sphaeroides]MCE6967284.1 AAA family ATPase [Cereibacter sphaeroides]